MFRLPSSRVSHQSTAGLSKTSDDRDHPDREVRSEPPKRGAVGQTNGDHASRLGNPRSSAASKQASVTIAPQRYEISDPSDRPTKG